MPCWTIQKTTIKTDKMNVVLLAEGLKAAGFDVKQEQGGLLRFVRPGSYLVHTYENGQLRMMISSSGSETFDSLASEIKRAYAAQAVRYATKKFGWRANEKQTQQGLEFVVNKRR